MVFPTHSGRKIICYLSKIPSKATKKKSSSGNGSTGNTIQIKADDENSSVTNSNTTNVLKYVLQDILDYNSRSKK